VYKKKLFNRISGIRTHICDWTIFFM